MSTVEMTEEDIEKVNEELKEEVKRLKDEIEMYNFFYEGNDFIRRGLHTSIQIANYIDELEAKYEKQKEINKEYVDEVEKLKEQLETLL